jgi:hypothetical protein
LSEGEFAGEPPAGAEPESTLGTRVVRPSSRAAAALMFGVGNRIASTVYGTITVMATLTAFANTKRPWELTTLVATTVVVLWIAHLYAHGLAESISLRQPLRLDELAHIAHNELGIVLAAVLPTAALLLGVAGVLDESTCVWIAIGISLATLAAQGFRYARVEAVGWKGTLTAVGANLALGLFVVALKVTVHH